MCRVKVGRFTANKAPYFVALDILARQFDQSFGGEFFALHAKLQKQTGNRAFAYTCNANGGANAGPFYEASQHTRAGVGGKAVHNLTYFDRHQIEVFVVACVKHVVAMLFAKLVSVCEEAMPVGIPRSVISPAAMHKLPAANLIHLGAFDFRVSRKQFVNVVKKIRIAISFAVMRAVKLEAQNFVVSKKERSLWQGLKHFRQLNFHIVLSFHPSYWPGCYAFTVT
jgi:hypothetical protein